MTGFLDNELSSGGYIEIQDVWCSDFKSKFPVRPIDEYGQVITSLSERLCEIMVLLKPLPALEHPLSFGGVIPELWGSGLGLELGHLVALGRCVKDASAGLRPA